MKVEVGQMWRDNRYGRRGEVSRVYEDGRVCMDFTNEHGAIVLEACLVERDWTLLRDADGDPPWIANTGTCPTFDDDYRFQLRFANGDEFDGDTDAEDYDWRLDLPPSDKITHWRTWEQSKQASSTEAALQRLTDNERELGLLEEMLSPKSGTYTVFSTSKTYDSEAEAREAALKFAATGGVWHVAKVIGSAVPQSPVWEGV